MGGREFLDEFGVVFAVIITTNILFSFSWLASVSVFILNIKIVIERVVMTSESGKKWEVLGCQ